MGLGLRSLVQGPDLLKGRGTRDVRAVRVRASHHPLREVPSGRQTEVHTDARGREGYEGPRHLLDYCRAAVEHPLSSGGYRTWVSRRRVSSSTLFVVDVRTDKFRRRPLQTFEVEDDPRLPPHTE